MVSTRRLSQLRAAEDPKLPQVHQEHLPVHHMKMTELVEIIGDENAYKRVFPGPVARSEQRKPLQPTRFVREPNNVRSGTTTSDLLWQLDRDILPVHQGESDLSPSVGPCPLLPAVPSRDFSEVRKRAARQSPTPHSFI